MRSPRINIRPADTSGWQQNGNCRDYPADLWFPDSYRSADGRLQAKTAKGICRSCPVRELCLDAALSHEGTISEDRREGVWGGHTPSERWLLARAQQLQAAA